MRIRENSTIASREPLPVWAIAALVIAARAPDFLPGSAWCRMEGGSAAMPGVFGGLPVWWLPITVLFVPALHALQEWQISLAVYLVAFIHVAVVNGAAWRHRVPLFLTTTGVNRALAQLLPKRRGVRFLDLGCGTGSVLLDMARLVPGGHYDGIETAPLSYLVSRWRVRGHAAVRVSCGNCWSEDFSSYDVVYACLSPQPMARLWHKACSEMRPGSLLISNTFDAPGVEPSCTIPVADCMHSVLYVWRMEEHCS